MAKHRPPQDAIEEFESAAERLAGWIGENRVAVATVVGVLLVSAAAWGAWDSWSRSRAESASVALERVRADYLTALGGSPGAIEPPEMANPAAAKAIREDFVPRFQAIADEHAGTVAGILALLELATLYGDLERADESAEIWGDALEAARGNPDLEGLLHQRIAASHEARGEWSEAADAYERAGELEGFPLRGWALADAARCAVAAGASERAAALYQRQLAVAPNLELPDHLRQQRRELEALD